MASCKLCKTETSNLLEICNVCAVRIADEYVNECCVCERYCNKDAPCGCTGMWGYTLKIEEVVSKLPSSTSGVWGGPIVRLDPPAADQHLHGSNDDGHKPD